MSPTLKPNQKILCFNWAYLFSNPKIGDLVAVRFKDKEIIKRITNMDKGRLFVEGDNKKVSTDSRNFGFITKEKIVGKIIWS